MRFIAAKFRSALLTRAARSRWSVAEALEPRMLLSSTVIDTKAMTISGPFPAGQIYGSPYNASVSGNTVTFVVEGPVSMPTGDTLTVQGANSAVVITTAFQNYNGNVALSTPGATFETQSGGITFAGAVTGTGTDLTSQVVSSTTFDGAVSLHSLTVVPASSPTTFAGSSVTTVTTQNFDNPVTLAADTSFSSTSGGAITFVAAVTGQFKLTTNTGGDATLGNGGSIGTLDVAGGTLTLGGANITATPASRSAIPAASGNLLNVSTQCIFNGGTTTVVQPTWTLDSLGPAVMTGPAAVIQLDGSNTAPGIFALGSDLTDAAASGSCSISAVGAGTIPGQVDLGAATRSFTVNGGTLAVSALITDGALRDAGVGLLQLSAANPYGGGTIVVGKLEADATLALGTGSVTFAGGTLSLRGANGTFTNSLTAAAANSITVDVGTGSYQFPSATLGSALNVLGTGSLTVTGAVTVPNAANPTTVNTSAAVTFAGSVSGGTGITLTGTGSLAYTGAGANSYTGLTTVVGGTLMLDDSGGLAIPADLLIDGPGGVLFQADNQMGSSHVVTFDATSGPATLNLNGHTQSLASIAIAPASPNPLNDIVALGSGSLTAGGGNATFDFPGVFTGTGTFTKAGSGVGTLDAVQPFSNVAGLAVNGGTLKMTASHDADTFSSLSINTAAGARLDLGNGSLKINYASPAADPVATIRSYLTSGFAGGAWNGAGLMTSAGLALGYGDSDEAGNIVGGLLANQILVKYTRPGDANLDGTVNFVDLTALAQHYGAAGASWDKGDFNYDNTVNFVDLVALAQNYNQATPAAVSATASLSPAVTPSSPASFSSTSDGHRKRPSLKVSRRHHHS